MFKIFETARKLREAGVIGLNFRNAAYVQKYNPRQFYPRADDKLLSKELAHKAGIAVPILYQAVHSQSHLKDKIDEILALESFVIKPVHGSGGQGVMVVASKNEQGHVTVSGHQLTPADIKFHLSNVLSGLYSLGGLPDSAMVEERVVFDPVFEKVAFRGVPDIRVITFLGVPVLGMLRLPTKASDGKANLHQGAIGTGIDIATGLTTSAVHRRSEITHHPDTKEILRGIQIPNWDKILNIAARSMDLTGLGYQGIDIVLDLNRGPLLLELNVRPGLAIQIANRKGLANRLAVIEKNKDSLGDILQRIDFAKKVVSKI